MKNKDKSRTIVKIRIHKNFQGLNLKNLNYPFPRYMVYYPSTEQNHMTQKKSSNAWSTNLNSQNTKQDLVNPYFADMQE